MNAGHTFQHEEWVLEGGGVLEGLQIFIRPRERDLEPLVQFHEFEGAFSEDEWRLLAGPAEGAPLTFRAEAWVHDIRLQAGRETSLPLAPVEGATRLLYVFAGRITVSDVTLKTGESILLNDDDYAAVAVETTDLVLFTTDPAAAVFAGGMFSGNVLAA